MWPSCGGCRTGRVCRHTMRCACCRAATARSPTSYSGPATCSAVRTRVSLLRCSSRCADGLFLFMLAQGFPPAKCCSSCRSWCRRCAGTTAARWRPTWPARAPPTTSSVRSLVFSLHSRRHRHHHCASLTRVISASGVVGVRGLHGHRRRRIVCAAGRASAATHQGRLVPRAAPGMGRRVWFFRKRHINQVRIDALPCVWMAIR